MRGYKAILLCIALVMVFLMVQTADAEDHHRRTLTFTVKIMNITKGVILTPPIVAALHHRETLVEIGKPASSEIEKIAEAGDTSDLATRLTNAGADVVEATAPILPGETAEIEVFGRWGDYLVIAAMLLPTNDGCIVLNSMPLRQLKKKDVFLSALDAGTEMNDELCSHIPGPQCGGEGYVEGGGEGYVYPHPSIHGEADLTQEPYDWSDPVAKISVTYGW